jgi:hypothetical protein
MNCAGYRVQEWAAFQTFPEGFVLAEPEVQATRERSSGEVRDGGGGAFEAAYGEPGG